MGWKLLRDAFSINHIVCVTDKGICIGSGYIHDLATINPTTGAMVASEASPGYIARTYPALANATPAELVALIEAVDSFDASIPVYTYGNGTIIEKQCEQAGYPNVTHDGHLMYENTFSTDKNQVIGWAKRNAGIQVEHRQQYLAFTQQQLADAEKDLAKAQENVRKLDAEHPDVPASA